MMQLLYSFRYDCGRMGVLSGLFFATEEDVKAAMGKSVYFGEVLGKHSEIEFDLTEDVITLVTDVPTIINDLQSLFPEQIAICGYNPLVYLCDYDDEDEDEDED